MNPSESLETTDKDIADRELKDLLSSKISELHLTIEDTRLGACVDQLYQELENADISFRPKTYLTDEWGCPNGVPVIGIPFYLAHPRLRYLQSRLTGIEAGEEVEMMMFLRHEAGHAFNYAYRLYRKPDWRAFFGRFSQPYKVDYKPIPFSAKFVRHSPGWYAQRHPDDDFAETFAVWLTPGSRWREDYAATPALAKLFYVDNIVRKYGRQPPIVNEGKLDAPVQEINITLNEWSENRKRVRHETLRLHQVLDNDLRSLFPAREGQPAEHILEDNRSQMIQDLNKWTGVNHKILNVLIDKLMDRIKFLGLRIEPERIVSKTTSVTVFFTTLAMNYIYRNQFAET